MRKNHQFLRGIILFGFEMLMLKLLFSHQLVYYIAPRMIIYVKICAAVFLIMAIVQMLQGILPEKKTHDDCGHDHSPPSGWIKNIVIYGLFIAPLLLGFLTPEKALSSSIAEKKGIAAVENTGMAQPVSVASALTMTDSELEQVFSRHGVVDKYTHLAVQLFKQSNIQLNDKTFVDAITVMNWFKPYFADKKVDLYGFVYREEGMKDNQFIVARFSVTCCTADASVYGLLVESDSAAKFKTDSWVKVSGDLSLEKYKDNDALAVKADHIEQIKAPAQPYIYQQAVSY